MRRSNGWTVTCLAAGSLALAVTHSGAHAACFQDAPQIAWSYPSHGDTDVPIDADIFVMVNTFGPPPNRITVNDVEVDSSGVGHFDPGPLAPNTALPAAPTLLHNHGRLPRRLPPPPPPPPRPQRPPS